MRPLPLFLALAWALVAACGPPQEGEAGTLLPPLALDEVGPAPLVPGTRLRLEGAGFVPPEVATLSVTLRGAVDGAPVDVTVTPERVDALGLVVPVTGPLADALFSPTLTAATFTGEVVVTRHPVAAGAPDRASLAVQLSLASTLAPRLTALAPATLYPGDVVTLTGADFLHPAEGAALVRFDGRFVVTSPPRVHTIAGLVVPAEPADPLTRDALTFTLTADVFGIRPGAFEGTVTVVNVTHAGDETASDPLAVPSLPLERPFVGDLGPATASRGQRVTATGRGLLPPDGLLQAATLLVFDGTFDPVRGADQTWTGVDALAVYPDDHDGNRAASLVLRVATDISGQLVGLGHTPGVFEGTVTPVLVAGPDRVTGVGRPVTLTIAPQLQVVWLRLLAGFDDALFEFGLHAEREAVARRLLEVVSRDYEGVNIAFTFDRPTDFEEYGVVEIGGRDPNGTKLFGLDNTAGKDVGNRRFDDVIGGFNAETRARGYAAYGGIFAAEFLNFSPTLSDEPIATPRFDAVFAAVVPGLGGVPAAPGEADGDGDRALAIREAVRVLGNLVGNTVSHEVGHSLGLTAIDGQFHNTGDNPGWIMDAGLYRPFEERAELDGLGPAVFSPFNRDYLQRILPVDP